MAEGSVWRDRVMCQPCTELGQCKLGVKGLHVTENEKIAGTFVVPDDVLGHVVAHGGWVAWAFDEILGMLPVSQGSWGVTSSLSIRYLRPVPVGAEVAVSAWRESAEGRIWHMRGEMRLASSGTLLASSSGDWAILDDVDAHYDRARQWCREVVGQ